MNKFNSIWSFGGSFSAEKVLEALEKCDLDYEVEKSPLLATLPNTMVPKMVGTFRTDTGAVLGVVGKEYGVVNNRDAFDFADYIENLEWVSGGTTETGLVYLIGKLPATDINGETFTPHIVFQNSFNGRWLLKGQTILVSSNGLVINLPFKSDIKIRHAKRVEDRVRLAKQALMAINSYIADFTEEANNLTQVEISTASLEVVVSTIFPIKEGATDRVRDNQLARRESFLESYNSDDNQPWWGTGWGIIKAFADFTARGNAKLASKNRRRAESVFENTLVSGKNYQKLIKQLENI